MDDIEFDPVDEIGAGAFGAPGQRTFVIQARKGGEMVSVLVEKEQVALFAAEATQFLDRLARDYPEATETGAPAGDQEPAAAGASPPGGAVHEAVPLFRARMIGLGFDPDRRLVLVELREDDADDEAEDDLEEESEGYVARLYATRAQIRAMVASGAAAVAAGRPACPLCEFPMDPAGHVCPRWN